MIPVTLFAYVCNPNIICLYFRITITIEHNLIITTMIIKPTISIDNLIIGKSITAITNSRTESPILSNFAPVWLAVLYFLARKPSKKSLIPQIIYIKINNGDRGLINSSINDNRILKKEIPLGMYLITDCFMILIILNRANALLMDKKILSNYSV